MEGLLKINQKLTALTSGKILGLYRGQIVNSLNALANETLNCEEKIRLTVSELRRKLGELLNAVSYTHLTLPTILLV